MASNLDLVTGGAGFIGGHLVDRLLATGRRVRVYDNLSAGRLSNLSQHDGNSQLEFVEGDISEASTAEAACAGVDRVFHLAALADIVPSIQMPETYYRANVTGTFSILRAAHRHRVRRFVYAASSSCYGLAEQVPTPETAPLAPQYPYALTKRMGEELVLHWQQVYGVPALSLRLFNVYGPRSRTTGAYGAVFGVFLGQLLAGEPLTVVGDGEQSRDFTFVEDVADAFVTAAECNRVGEIYNVGSGRAVSVNTLVKLLGAANTVHIPERPGEPACTLADTSKIQSELGWRPQVAIEEGVKRMLADIDRWRDAPVWTVDRIAEATSDWFRYLGKNDGG